MIVRHKVYHRLDYHLVFVTKFREGFLTREVLSRFEALCQKKANELGFIMHISNGYLDHVHLLVSLKPVHQVSEIIRHIKGFTSREIRGLKWQRGITREKSIELVKRIRETELSVLVWIRFQHSGVSRRGFT